MALLLGFKLWGLLLIAMFREPLVSIRHNRLKLVMPKTLESKDVSMVKCYVVFCIPTQIKNHRWWLLIPADLFQRIEKWFSTVIYVLTANEPILRDL
jgi:hypothetical protein